MSYATVSATQLSAKSEREKSVAVTARSICRAAGREYDAWSDDIFNAIQAGDYREDLVRDFIDHLEYLIDQNKSESNTASSHYILTHYILFSWFSHYGGESWLHALNRRTVPENTIFWLSPDDAVAET